MVISVLSLTWNRVESVKQCYWDNIHHCGVDRGELELLIADQGSTDGVIDYMRSFHPDYLRLNKFNEGIGRAFNQLLVRAKGDFICLVGTDIKCQPGWMRELLNYAQAVPNAGIMGMQCTAETPPLRTRTDIRGNPCHAHYLDAKWDKVFGTQFFSRKVLETVGGFHEGFHPYGFEDSDLNNRVNLAGFQSLYVPPPWRTEHVCNDVGDNTEYRKMKDLSLAANMDLFGKRHHAYITKTLPIFEPLPAPRPPLLEEPSPIVVNTDNIDVEAARRTPMGV